MEDVREYIRDVLVMYSSLQSFQPKPNERAHRSDVSLAPQMSSRVAMPATVLSLQGADVRVPGAGSVCYSGKLLMRNFGFPYEVDRLVMQQGYPWLDAHVQPGCPPEVQPTAPA